MEYSYIYKTGSINFLRILFWIGLVMVGVILILFFTLHVNDSVGVNQGMIFSESPQSRITSPDEVQLSKVFIKEGQSVNKGDTLFILEKVKTKTDYFVSKMGLKAQNQNLTILNELMENAEKRKEAIHQLIGIQSEIYQTDRRKLAQELKSLKTKKELTSKQATLSKDKYMIDSLLYAKGVISKMEWNEKKNVHLSTRKGQVDIESQFQQRENDYTNLSHSFLKFNNNLQQSLLEFEKQIIDYRKNIIDLEMDVNNKEYNLNYFKDELEKLMVLSPIKGTITTIFNTKQTSKYIVKDELLAVVTPIQESFYARATLPERDLVYIQKGQEVVLKVDAYNFHKYGAVRGKITYVSAADVEREFYCMIELKDYSKNIKLKAGYRLKGDIIIERLSLFQYLKKKLLNSLDNNIHPEKPKKVKLGADK